MTMFKTRSFIKHDEPIQLPDCMYKIKNILGNENYIGERTKVITNNSDISQQKEVNTEMSQLQNRQEQILKQLEELQKQMFNIKKILNVTDEPNVVKEKAVIISSPKEEAPIDKKGKLYDFVVNVDPSHPPYSLLMLKKLWSSTINLVVKSYVHSSVINLSPVAAEFSKLLDKEEPITDAPYIFIRLIWKNTDDKLVLMTNCTPVHGEANFLRHLSRIGPNKLNYESLEKPWEIDTVLDICYLLSRAKTKTERMSLLQNLNSKLGKSQWVCNGNVSIADIAANSVIKQVMSPSELNVNLSKWFDRCETL